MSFAALTSPRPALTLFFTYRPALDEIFSLDAANGAYYRLLNIGRYVLVMYGAAKLIKRAYPAFFMLFNRDRLRTGNEAEGVNLLYVSSWRRALKAFITISARWGMTEFSSLFLQKALDVSQPLATYNLPGLAVRGLNRLCFKLAFKDGEAALRQMAQSTASVRLPAASRGLVLDEVTALSYPYIYCFIQPLPYHHSSVARETAIEGAGNTEGVTSALLDKYRLNATDGAVSLLASIYTEFGCSLLSYGVLPWLRGMPVTFSLGRLVTPVLCTVSTLLSNAIVSRVCGPTTSSVSIHKWKVSVLQLTLAVNLASIMLSRALEFAILTKLFHARRKVRSYFVSGGDTAEEERMIAEGLADFREIVGRDWGDMTSEDVEMMEAFFSHLTVEGIPREAAVQYGSADMMALFIVLSTEFPIKYNMLKKALNCGAVEQCDASYEVADTCNDEHCSACQEPLNNAETCTVSKCHHTFHSACLADHLDRRNSKCPVCEDDILPESARHPLLTPQILDSDANPAFALSNPILHNVTAEYLYASFRRKYSFMQPWGSDLFMLTDFIALYATSANRRHQILSNFVEMMGQHYDAQVNHYAFQYPPFNLLVQYEKDDAGRMITNVQGDATWLLVKHILYSLLRAESFWGVAE